MLPKAEWWSIEGGSKPSAHYVSDRSSQNFASNIEQI